MIISPSPSHTYKYKALILWALTGPATFDKGAVNYIFLNPKLTMQSTGEVIKYTKYIDTSITKCVQCACTNLISDRFLNGGCQGLAMFEPIT